MALYFGGTQYLRAYLAGQEISKALVAGNEAFAKPSTPAAPAHEFRIRCGGNNNTVGFNRGNWGRFLSAAETETFDTPGGITVTINMARRLRNSAFIFVISGTGLTTDSLAEFPARITANRTGQTELVCTRPSRLSSISAGIRGDYDVSSGNLSNMFQLNQDVDIDLYY